MRVLILFSIVGVALYGLLLATDSALSDHEAPRAAHSDQRSQPSFRSDASRLGEQSFGVGHSTAGTAGTATTARGSKRSRSAIGDVGEVDGN
jgi:hypothetical protein